MIAGRSPDADDLASQPTLSRFENAISVPMLRRLQDVFIDQFIASFDEPPTRLTFDIDTYDDPT
ncbi:MAG: transposase, partial [Planctomycetes bacterium]|nr:transposase [Planctomycetota bacterium]